MGETGCGKTRLIRYMCQLLNLNAPVESFLIVMKVRYFIAMCCNCIKTHGSELQDQKSIR